MLGAVGLSTTHARPSMIQPFRMYSMFEAIFATGQANLPQKIQVTDYPV